MRPECGPAKHCQGRWLITTLLQLKKDPRNKDGKRSQSAGPGTGSRTGTPPLALSPGRKWLFRLLALALPVFALCALEAGLRLAGYGYATPFFKKIRIQNQEFLVQNDNFSLRFFPPETARNPGPIRMRVHKPPGAYRIFILGESAVMGDPEPAFGASRYLEMLL